MALRQAVEGKTLYEAIGPRMPIWRVSTPSTPVQMRKADYCQHDRFLTNTAGLFTDKPRHGDLVVFVTASSRGDFAGYVSIQDIGSDS